MNHHDCVDGQGRDQRMIFKPWIITGGLIGIVLLSGVAFWQGYRWGKRACEHQHHVQLLRQIEKGQDAEEQRIRLMQERDELARKVEESIHAAPIVVHRCLGPSRSMQLNAEGVGH